MLRYSNLSFIAFFFTLLIGGSCFTVFGQPIWLDRSTDKAITLEILKPNFSNGEGITFSTSAWFLTGRFAVGNTISVVGQIPYAYYGFDYNGSSESQDAFGNIYAGMEIHGRNSPVFGEIGVYLPTAPNWDNESFAAAFLGIYTDLVDRAEAYSPEVTPVCGMINYYQKSAGGLVLHFRSGPSVWLDTGDNSDETELYLLYAAQVGYAAPKVELLAGFSGRWWLSSGDAAENIGEKTWHQLGFAGNIGLGNFRPGIILRVPIDEDYSDVIDFVFGLTLGINLP
jgi:hypothetical protein